MAFGMWITDAGEWLRVMSGPVIARLMTSGSVSKADGGCIKKVWKTTVQAHAMVCA